METGDRIEKQNVLAATRMRGKGCRIAIMSGVPMEPDMNERISINPNICHGQACIRGTRIPVHQIVAMLGNGDTIEALLDAYPSLNREDILAALRYAGQLAEEQVSPLDLADSTI